MDQVKLQHIRAAALAGRLPEGLTPKDVEDYSADVVADFEALASLQGVAEARRCLRYQLLALKRAEGAVLVPRARALVDQAERDGLI